MISAEVCRGLHGAVEVFRGLIISAEVCWGLWWSNVVFCGPKGPAEVRWGLTGLYCKYDETLCSITSCPNRAYFSERTLILTLVMTSKITHVNVLQTLPNCLIYEIN